MKDESLVKVKICGLTSTKEASLLYKSGADYTGLVLFYEKSRRNNTVANAWQILRYVPREIQRVAVTVSPTLEQLKLIEQMDFHLLQVHGELREEVAKAAGLPIWRAYNISGGEIPAPGAYDEKITGGKKLILAGGLKADNVCQAIEALHPDVVDVSSGVETDGGKDAAKIKEFVRKVKQYG